MDAAALHDMRVAGANLLNLLLSWKAKGQIQYCDLAQACYFAGGAGTPGADWQKYALPPGKQSGRYAQKLKDVLPSPGWTYKALVPVMKTQVEERTSRWVELNAVWEEIADDIRKDPQILQAARDRTWPRSYYRHSVVKEAQQQGRDLPLPFYTFIDGVAYSVQAGGRSYTITGMWVVSMTTGKHYYVGGMRSQESCRCGCRGWCSVYPLLLFLKHVFRILRLGRRLLERHDHSEWQPDDPLYAKLTEGPLDLGFTACLQNLDGDWMESVHSLGFKSPTSNYHACPYCHTTKHIMHNHYGDARPGRCPWQLKEAASYNAACLSCEIVVVVMTQAERREIIVQGELDYKKGQGHRGRELQCDVPSFGLQAGDRLEPSESLVDIGEFETKRLPFQCVFWRTHRDASGSCTDMTTHRCPLIDAEDLGTTNDNVQADILHTVYYGPAMRLLVAILWRIILLNPWGVRGNQEQRINLAVRHLRGELQGFNKRSVESNYQVRDLTLKMLGDQRGADAYQNPHPGGVGKFKAAECGIMLLFVIELLETHDWAIPCKASLLTAVKACLNFWSVCECFRLS